MGKLGDIFRAHGSEYRRRFEERMSLDQLRAMDAIETCHTPAAGSALWRCTSCGHGHFTYQVYISESAILQHDEKGVTLRYRKSGTNEPKTLRLVPMEFLRRFLQHVLPSHFCKVRLWAAPQFQTRLRKTSSGGYVICSGNQPAEAACYRTAPYCHLSQVRGGYDF